MTTEEINKIAMQQSAVELGCKTEDFFQNENKMVSSVSVSYRHLDVYKRHAFIDHPLNQLRVAVDIVIGDKKDSRAFFFF